MLAEKAFERCPRRLNPFESNAFLVHRLLDSQSLGAFSCFHLSIKLLLSMALSTIKIAASLTITCPTGFNQPQP